MDILYQAIKMIFAFVFSIGQIVSPKIAGGDFPPSQPAEPGDTSQYIQISADDEGFDTWQPVKNRGGYRYGPSMILNSNFSLDVWSASNGPGDLIDLVSYKRYSPDFKNSTKEVIALKPTAESFDRMWTCDPGVVKFGDYYYIGYTTTANPNGIQNVVCVARSKNPEGPFDEKWTGSGWGTDVRPLFEYTDDQNCFGAGEPSFVVVGETLYV